MLRFGSWVNNRRCVALSDVLGGRPETERMRSRLCASAFWEMNRFRLHAGSRCHRRWHNDLTVINTILYQPSRNTDQGVYRMCERFGDEETIRRAMKVAACEIAGGTPLQGTVIINRARS